MNQLTPPSSARQQISSDTLSQRRCRRFAFIMSRWHADIVEKARDAFIASVEAYPLPHGVVDVFEVPGAFEIPLHARKLAASGHYDAIVACGLVVDGGIYRHEFVADAVISGLMRVQLDTEVPVISAVLTPHHFHDHQAHSQFFAEHFVVKGREAAEACLRTVESLEKLPALLRLKIA